MNNTLRKLLSRQEKVTTNYQKKMHQQFCTAVKNCITFLNGSGQSITAITERLVTTVFIVTNSPAHFQDFTACRQTKSSAARQSIYSFYFLFLLVYFCFLFSFNSP